MASFRCYDNFDVIATLVMTNFHLNTTVVAIFPNACLWRHSLYSNLVLTLKTNCIKPSSYASTAYVVVIRPSSLSDSFVKIWATCEIFLGKWFTVPPGKKNSHTPMSEILPPSTQQDEIPRKYILINTHAKQKKQIEVENISFSGSRGFSSVDLFHDTPPSLLALKDCLNNSRVCPLKCHVVLLLPNQS